MTMNVKIIIITALVLLAGTASLVYFVVHKTNQISTSTITKTDFVSGLSKVQPASPISFDEYKILDLSDGRQLLSVPKAALTREPFSSAVDRFYSGQKIFREQNFFFYDPKVKEVTFLGPSLTNFATIKVKNVEYWVFSLANIDGTEKIFYSLPSFLKQRQVKSFPAFVITKFQSKGSLIEVTVNKSQRDVVLEKYSIDFTNFKFNTNTTTAEFTDKGPTVKIIQ